MLCWHPYGAHPDSITSSRQCPPAAAQAYVVRQIPDVERNGYCFSDGVGRISYDLCEVVARLEAPSPYMCFMLIALRVEQPSCFQGQHATPVDNVRSATAACVAGWVNHCLSSVALKLSHQV